MAENENQTKTVYEFDLASSAHPLTGSVVVPESTPLGPNQTEIKPNEGSENYWNGTGWVSDLVVVYEFDPTQNNLFTGVNMIPQGAVLAANQTFVKPEDGLYQPMRFNGITWIGTPKEEWEKANPAPEQKPSASQIAQANTLKTVAELQVAHTGQQKLNADLMKDNASLKKKNESQAKINADLMKDMATLKKQVATLTTTPAQ